MLKKQLTVPGALVQLKPVLKNGLPGVINGPSSSEIDFVTIAPGVGSIMITGAWRAGPGTLLEIVRSPRRSQGINSVRVRRTDDPTVEGEVYWCELRASANHI